MRQGKRKNQIAFSENMVFIACTGIAILIIGMAIGRVI
tara:strand:+ start:330 stop:443 length:114 start_codon:yes stop_codon:yes gene_type:complete